MRSTGSGTQKSIGCHTCQKTFKTKRSLEEHLSTSSAPHPACIPCSKRFTSEEALLSHYKGSPKHPNCITCAAGFVSRDALKVHQDIGCQPGKPKAPLERGIPSPATIVGQVPTIVPRIAEAEEATLLEQHLPRVGAPGLGDSVWSPTSPPSVYRRPARMNLFDSQVIQERFSALPNQTVVGSAQGPSKDLVLNTKFLDEPRYRFPSIYSTVPGVPSLPEVQAIPGTPSSYASPSDESSLESELLHPMSSIMDSEPPLLNEEPPSAIETKHEAFSPFGHEDEIVAPSLPSSSSPTSSVPVTTLRVHCRDCNLSPCAEPTTTICGHLFCRTCIEKAVLTSRACPVCQNMLIPQCLYRLHLED